jgi:hypothetical protein
MVTKTTVFQSRKSDRVKSELPIVIDGVQAIIRDISTTGVFLEVKNPVEPNSIIEFLVTLDHPTGKLVFSCQGEVVRMEELEESYGVATKILSMYLMPLLDEKT